MRQCRRCASRPTNRPYSERVRERDLRVLVVVAEPLRGDDGAEDLGGDELVALLQIGNERGLIEEPSGSLPVSAGEHPGVVRRPVDEAGDVLELVLVVDGAVQDVVVIGVKARLGVAHGLGHGGEEVVVHRRPG